MSDIASESPVRRIYRIEDANGEGPYRRDGGQLAIPQYCSREHPNPCEEPELGWRSIRDNDRWFFGFESLDQLKEWFYELDWLDAMQREGLRITIWEVPIECVRCSSSQAIFVKEAATLVGTQSLIH